MRSSDTKRRSVDSVDRTFVFVQPIQPRRLVLPATTEGLPTYVGDAEHTLRFSKDPA